MGSCISQEIFYGLSPDDQPIEKILYHGSPIDIKDDNLLVHSNKLIDRPVLFVSEKKWLALCYCNKKWNNNEIRIGVINNNPIILELKEGSFQTYFKKNSGFLYKLENNGQFQGYFSLGFRGTEWISSKNQKIIDKYYILDIWNALRLEEIDGEVILIKYNTNARRYNYYKEILLGNKILSNKESFGDERSIEAGASYRNENF